MTDDDVVSDQHGSDKKRTEYSTAFERMTKGDHNDLIGLVAYARYKQMVRDEVLQGQRTAGTPKNPSDQVVEFYRNAARQELQTFAAYAIDEATEEIQRSAILDRFDRATSEIKQHISQSTGPLRAIVTNVIAWAFTLIITVLAFWALQQPRIFEMLPDGTGSDVGVPADESDTQLPDQ